MGGTFTSYTKSRPGAYINFKSVPTPMGTLGTRGILTMPVALAWGDTITELLSSDLSDGNCQKKIGYTVFDEEALLFKEALKHCYKAIIYRLDTGGTKASSVLAPITATAKYAGVVGNTISVKSIVNGAKFDVVTSVNSIEKDRQTVTTVEELEDNDWVVFSGTGNVVANAGVTATGGTNGTIVDTTYTTYLNSILAYEWNTMAIPQDASASVDTVIINWLKDVRDNQGKKIQCVMYNVDADYEGIISVSQGYSNADKTVNAVTFVAYVGGLTAGSDINTSNTYHVIEGATTIINPLTNTEIVAALKLGKLVISKRSDGVIVIEQDINNLYTFTSDKNYVFSKNRVLRALDEINNSIGLLFSKSYTGKVNNNADGRNLFKADVINYLNLLQNANAIQNFDSSTDIEILAGTTIDAIIVNLAIQPVDSMEKLYMSVLVQ
jgi:hypothetical protein